MPPLPRRASRRYAPRPARVVVGREGRARVTGPGSCGTRISAASTSADCRATAATTRPGSQPGVSRAAAGSRTVAEGAADAARPGSGRQHLERGLGRAAGSRVRHLEINDRREAGSSGAVGNGVTGRRVGEDRAQGVDVAGRPRPPARRLLGREAAGLQTGQPGTLLAVRGRGPYGAEAGQAWAVPAEQDGSGGETGVCRHRRRARPPASRRGPRRGPARCVRAAVRRARRAPRAAGARAGRGEEYQGASDRGRRPR